MKLKDAIRAERTRAGMTQRDLAESLGITHGAVGQWENGSTRPEPAKVMQMSELFGVSPGSLMGEDAAFYVQVVEDPDEMLLLSLWRRLPTGDRTFVIRMLRNGAMVQALPDREARRQDQGG